MASQSEDLDLNLDCYENLKYHIMSRILQYTAGNVKLKARNGIK
jgi:hypothetical protein